MLIPLVRNGWRLYGPAPELDRVEQELAQREERGRRPTAGATTRAIGERASRGAASRRTPSRDRRRARLAARLLGWTLMATAPSEPLSQRLAAIRDQLKLLADYL